ncbi:MAG: 5-deoxy-glucuronate isomerase [Limnochordales bacterium]|nr:5-deoxy-glucuronate isomerase [Limnochordales bacterium]
MASRLLIRPGGDARTPIRITPQDAGWEYVSFSVHALAAGESLQDATGGEEVGLVLLGGRATVRSSAGTWEHIGGRADVFDGLPWAVYLPPGVEFEVHAETDLQLARGGAPAAKGAAARLIRPEDVEVVQRGSGSAQRRIHNILMGNLPAERLLLVEVITPGGNWSSYPPHKHDTHRPPEETYLEEVYYHRLQPANGFALQRVYTDDRSLDATLAVGDGEAVLVPRGYHPVAAPPGFDLYYLNVMAGPERDWKFHIDPDFRRLAGEMGQQPAAK